MRKLLTRLLLASTGWRVEGVAPDEKKFVLIAAPHTSNWDFVYAMAAAAILDVPIHWMGKDALFRGAGGVVSRALGGIAVDRSKKNHLVDALAQEFARHERFVLLVPAEGTRQAGTHWKSGFYHIARAAQVPIALGYLDYRTKRVGIGPVFRPTGDIATDMALIRAFYADKQGKYPAQFTTPRLREEDAQPSRTLH